MISNQQKSLLHKYARAARLQEPIYRSILKAHAGVASAADPDMTQSGFEGAMAALETVLWERVAAGDAAPPARIARDYWRRRADRNTPGRVNSRQYHKIMQIWAQLGEWMPDGSRTPEYFAGIIHRATGKNDIGVTALSASQAWSVIEALKDRLSHAIRAANRESANLPF